MTVEELLQQLEVCTTAPRHKCDVCLELIRNFCQQERKEALLALARWIGPQNVTMGSHDLQELANDPEYLAKVMGEEDQKKQVFATFREQVLRRVELCEAELRTHDPENYKRYMARMELIIKAFDEVPKED